MSIGLRYAVIAPYVDDYREVRITAGHAGTDYLSPDEARALARLLLAAADAAERSELIAAQCVADLVAS